MVGGTGPAGEPVQRGGRLFVYGTLRFPEILHSLLNRTPHNEPDSAEGWRAAEIPGETYPALVPANGIVPGLVLDGLGPREWDIVDAFEGPFYELRRIPLTSGRSEWSYVCTDPSAVGADDWSPGRFAQAHLGEYVRDCADWRREQFDGDHEL